MKSINSSSISSVESSTTVASSSESELRDSNYFPGCRKDANCSCEICIASINATLDLLPQSIHRSSLTKLSSSKPTLPKSPISFNPLTPSTPKSRTDQSIEVPKPLDCNVGSGSKEKMKRKKKQLGIGVSVFRVILGLTLAFAAEFGLSGVLRRKLSADVVRNMGEKSVPLGDLAGKLSFLKEELRLLADNDSLNSSYMDSVWQINKDGLLLSSKRALYGSMTEEITIWGWPLQTAGLLTAGLSSRSFTILSGRLTEWRNGEVGYVIRKTNESWVQEKWSAYPVQLDPNTWILEYRQRAMMENTRLISALLELLKFRLMREVKQMQRRFWLQFTFGNQCSQFTTRSLKIPT